MHGLTRRYLKVHTLTFGTRLTNITHCLRNRDRPASRCAWPTSSARLEGRHAHRRVPGRVQPPLGARLLGANAALLLVTDGLDRDDAGELSRAAAQLRRLAHQIVWLNPLLRYDGFEARAAGVRALLPRVDRFLPVHNLASLADLGRALRGAAAPREPLPT
ncbi:MAG: VWA domain-containing protein [Ideonella sp.]|nr:VWA domain-containing protein [Ideonella sp.]